MITYLRECVTAKKVHRCGYCDDPICAGELYTTFKYTTGYMFKQGPKRCSQCEPILMHDGKLLTKAIVRNFKHSKKQTWNEAVQTFGFESFADFSAYFGSAVPLLSRN